MARKLTDAERQRIETLLTEGKSYREIGRTIGRGHSAIANVAKSIGHRSGRSNLARAQEARSAYTAERRAVLAARLTEEAEKLLDDLGAEFRAYNFGGKDNTYTEELLPEPGPAEKRMLVQAAREALRTVLDIDRHDNRAEEGAAAVDEWLRGMLRDEGGGS